MKYYDGAEVFELVWSYMLYQLKHVVKKENVGLYRDDSLAVLPTISKPEIERKKKQVLKD